MIERPGSGPESFEVDQERIMTAWENFRETQASWAEFAAAAMRATRMARELEAPRSDPGRE